MKRADDIATSLRLGQSRTLARPLLSAMPVVRVLRMTQELPDVGHRAVLLDMAQTWFEAADQLEQRGVILGVPLTASQLDKS